MHPKICVRLWVCSFGVGLPRWSNLPLLCPKTFPWAKYSYYYAPPLIGGGIKRWSCLTSVCPSRTSGLSREQRHRKTKIVTELAHVTRDSDTISMSRGQRSRSPGHFTHRSINASGSCSGECGNVLSVGTYCYVAVCRHGRLGGQWWATS